jgi:hypothetical protein
LGRRANDGQRNDDAGKQCDRDSVTVR